MKLGLMAWQDVQSYQGEHEIDWSQIRLASIQGPNGAGKSTLIDIVRWALFGATRGSADSIIRREADSCEATLEFESGGISYGVRRVRSRKGGGKGAVAFWRGKDRFSLNGTTARETDQKIADVLGMDDALFCATACASQGDAGAFSEATAAGRKEILGRILRLERWDVLLEYSRREAATLEGRLQPLQGRRDAVEQRAASVDTLSRELEELRALVVAAEGRVEQGEALVKALKERQAALLKEATADTLARHKVDALSDRFGDAQYSWEQAAGALATMRERTADADAIIDRLDRAEEAAAELEAQVGVRAFRDALDARVKAAAAEIVAAKRERAAAIAAHDAKIVSLRKAHNREIEVGRAEEDRLSQTAWLLEEVPCAGDTKDACKLLAQAREAAGALAPLRERLVALEGTDPAAEEAATLARYQETTAPQIAALEEAHRLLQVDLTEIAYDEAHVAALTKACQHRHELADMASRQKELLSQIPDAEKKELDARGQRDSLAADLEAMQAALGPVTDWAAKDAELVHEGRTLAAALDRSREAITAQRDALAAKGHAMQAALEAKAELEELTEEIAAVIRRRDLQQALSNPRTGAFSKAGIPALLIEQAVPELEAEIADVLRSLTGGALTISLRSQRETGAKSLIEVLDVIVQDQGGERPYESYSGGERMRIDLALRIGLSTLLARRAGARCEVLVLDEAAAPLDADGRQVFAECLAQIADRFSTVLAVSHVSDLQDLLPQRIEVTRGTEGSRLEVIG